MHKRIIALVAGVALQACLGGIYAWSVFVPALRETFGYSAAQTQIVFGTTIMVFTSSMLLAGRGVDKLGARPMAFMSALLIFAGYATIGHFGDSFAGLLLGMGILNGLAIGCGYLCAISTGMKWFPERKGLITGLMVAGYGGGAIVLSAIGESLLGIDWDIMHIFRMIGYIYGPLVFIAGLLLFQPQISQARQDRHFIFPARSPAFWAFIAAMAFGSYPAISLIGTIKPIALFYELPVATAVASVTALSIGNASGRIAWGVLQDHIGDIRTGALLFCAIFISIVLIPVGASSSTLFLAAAFFVGFSFGGCLSIFAAQTAHHFGAERLGSVYPFVMLFHGIGALIGPWVTGFGFDRYGSYTLGITCAAISALLGLLFYTSLMRISQKRRLQSSTIP
jgi:MFS transporter, OFA family, oxalate/formate antiporter